MHEQTSNVWPRQQKALFSSLGRHWYTHTRTIIIILIILETLICFKMCKHTHTQRKQPRHDAFHYSSIPYVWLSIENPDLRLESGLNLKDERGSRREEEKTGRGGGD